MREIKFRVWDNICKGMFYPEKSKYCITMVGSICEDETDDGGILENRSYRTEAMQYTGLKDKNGVDIYDGDILRIPPSCQYEETTYNCFEVFYHDNECIGGQNIGFCMNRMHTHGSSAGGSGYRFTPEAIKKHRFVVIGNIHENPELLK